MDSNLKKHNKKFGRAPGTLSYTGKNNPAKLDISIIEYDRKTCNVHVDKDERECIPFLRGSKNAWVNINGIHETDVLEFIGKHLAIHPLTLEDIAITSQRPKLEVYPDYLFLVAKMISYDKKTHEISAEQVSIVLTKKSVLSFQEHPDDIFNPIRKHLKESGAYIRKASTDYLAYALIDAIIDNFFKVLEFISDDIEDLEEELLNHPSDKTLHKIHQLKRQMIILRKAVWPMRELVNDFIRTESNLLKEESKVYLRDAYDHTIQVIDSVETFRDLIAGMLDIYLSNLSNRMNQIMKVLTIIATIFIPLTFLTGIYGMNFKYMPELEYAWGYPALIGVMLLISAGMLYYFRRRKWL